MFLAGCPLADQAGRLPQDARSGRLRARVIRTLLPTPLAKEGAAQLAAYLEMALLCLRAQFAVKQLVIEARERSRRSARCSYLRVFAKRSLRCLEVVR